LTTKEEKSKLKIENENINELKISPKKEIKIFKIFIFIFFFLLAFISLFLVFPISFNALDITYNSLINILFFYIFILILLIPTHKIIKFISTVEDENDVTKMEKIIFPIIIVVISFVGSLLSILIADHFMDSITISFFNELKIAAFYTLVKYLIMLLFFIFLTPYLLNKKLQPFYIFFRKNKKT
jgi:hypothetical protein